MHILYTHMHACIHTYMSCMHMYKCKYIQAYIHTYMHTCTYMYAYIIGAIQVLHVTHLFWKCDTPTPS